MIVAHALGGVRDLPVPGEFFLYGGAIVLGLSFIALGFLWTDPHLEHAEQGRPLPPLVQRVALSRALRVVVGAISVAIFLTVVAAAYGGTSSINRNLAPTAVWIGFWLGLVPVSLLLGNVWAAISPLRTLADGVAWLARPLRWQTLPYPERLGRWPAAALLFAFVAMELVYPTPAEPRAVGTALVVYSILTWTGMLFFGRRAWLENGEAFHVYYGLFGRMAPFAVRGEGERRQVVVRPPLVGLAPLRLGPGMIAFVAVMLGSVGFDSITRTSFWQNFEAGSLTTDATRIPVRLLVLLAVVAFVAGAYLLAMHFAASTTASRIPLAPLFLGSLVPIALVYSIAHYVSLLASQGQYLIPLVSDPFGKGWDLFGSAHFTPNLVPIAPGTLWYVQVATLVAGHVLGLVLAHDRSVGLFEGAAVLRSQYAMLALMVLYTIAGLYLLSSP